MAYEPDELRLEVRDHGGADGTGPDGPGHGLVGIGERVKIFGGEMSAGPAPGRRVPRARPAARNEGAGMTIRVLVVDDQSMVRAGFRLLLADEPDIEVVAEASNGREAVAHAARLQPDVILMDIRMPELDGLEATRRILATDTDRRGCWSSPPSTSTTTCSRRCAPGPAGSCSRTTRPSSCSRPCGPSPPARRCCPRR